MLILYVRSFIYIFIKVCTKISQDKPDVRIVHWEHFAGKTSDSMRVTYLKYLDLAQRVEDLEKKIRNASDER